MDFFETAEDVEVQMVAARAQLEAIDGDVPRSTALDRIRGKSAFHPVLLLRMLFMVMATLVISLAIAAFFLPFFANYIDPKIPSMVLALQHAMGNTPLPIAIAAGGALIAIAGVAVDQAAVAIGRGSDLLAQEIRDKTRLEAELIRLTRQREIILRSRTTPTSAASRYSAPRATSAPSPNFDRSEPVTYDGFPASAPYTAPPSMPPSAIRPSSTPSSVPQRTSDGYARFRTPVTNGREASPILKSTTISLGSESQYTPSHGPVETHTDQFPEPTGTTGSAEAAEQRFVIDSEDDAPTYVTTGAQPSYVVDNQPHHEGSFDRRTSTQVPNFAEVNEAWLKDAINKSAVLAHSFPIQARLDFNQAKNVPFTLVLERATPAMAVRAMMAYVEFLSTISLPKRARIELVSVAHLDSTFHRNVRAACAPYFPDGVEIRNEPGCIELIFDNPDARWDRFPLLPIAH